MSVWGNSDFVYIGPFTYAFFPGRGRGVGGQRGRRLERVKGEISYASRRQHGGITTAVKRNRREGGGGGKWRVDGVWDERQAEKLAALAATDKISGSCVVGDLRGLISP